MNLKTSLKVALTATAITFGSAASAAVYDFAYQADNVAPFENGYSSYSLTESGITVTATGTDVVTGNTNYFAYLDASTAYGPAGLGVCKELDSSNQCNPSKDDNTTLGEKLHLTFSESVEMQSITFVNGKHGSDFDDNMFNVSIDGGTAMSYNLTNTFNTTLNGTHFDFWLADQADAAYQNQFYISAITAVPAPAPLALLALGLLGLYGTSKKKKSA